MSWPVFLYQDLVQGDDGGSGIILRVLDKINFYCASKEVGDRILSRPG